MNKSDIKILNEFPEGLNDAIFKKFGIKSETKFDFLGGMNYQTIFVTHGDEALKEKIELFVDGFVKGNIELRNRLFKQQ